MVIFLVKLDHLLLEVEVGCDHDADACQEKEGSKEYYCGVLVRFSGAGSGKFIFKSAFWGLVINWRLFGPWPDRINHSTCFLCLSVRISCVLNLLPSYF